MAAQAFRGRVMSRNMDWRRAKRFRSHEPNTTRGSLLPPRDTLERKAARALRSWEKKLSPRDRQKLTG
jgi:hypothetical protein